MNWLNITLTVLSIIIPVYATIYTANKRVKNDNVESHKPYLVLNKVIDIEQLNIYAYYLTPIGKRYLKNHPNLDYFNIKSKNDINVKLLLKNIGYGVATNVKFYDLITGEQVHGEQAFDILKNQKLFTTYDMQVNEEKSMQARIINLVEEKNGIVIEDKIKMLCVYSDLNRNTYNFIIGINAGKDNHYDFFAYQRSSHSYDSWIKENKATYKKIIKTYKNK